jgi:hypothetical protein
LSYCILVKQNVTVVPSVSTYGKLVINLFITICLSIPDQVRGGIGSCTCFLEGTRHKACCTPWQVSSSLNLLDFFKVEFTLIVDV